MKKLISEYSYKIVEQKDFYKVFKAMRKEVFKDTFTIQIDEFETNREREFIKTFKKREYFRLPILVFFKNEIVAWHYGFQKGSSYYMMNTGVIEKHQRKGIYTALLKEIISITYKEGFLDLKSRHLASNNKVLIPKLKAGFVITGMEIDETFGTLINLKYFFNEKIKEVYLMRTGELKPTSEILD